jgi:hypothetical protein
MCMMIVGMKKSILRITQSEAREEAAHMSIRRINIQPCNIRRGVVLLYDIR